MSGFTEGNEGDMAAESQKSRSAASVENNDGFEGKSEKLDSNMAPRKRKIDHEMKGLDSQFQCCRKLMAEHINTRISTCEINGCYEFFYYDRPISRVEVTGIITGILHRLNKSWVTIDDSSGSLVRCVKYINENQYNHLDPMKEFNIGMLVTVRGTLQKIETNEFPYCFIIQVTAIDVLTDPNMELYHWTSSMSLHKNEYILPWSKPLNLTSVSISHDKLCTCRSDNEYKVVQDVLDYCPCVASYCCVDKDCLMRMKLLLYLILDKNHSHSHSHSSSLITYSKISLNNNAGIKEMANECFSRNEALKLTELQSGESNKNDTCAIKSVTGLFTLQKVISDVFDNLCSCGVFVSIEPNKYALSSYDLLEEHIQSLIKAELKVVEELKNKKEDDGNDFNFDLLQKNLTSKMHSKYPKIPLFRISKQIQNALDSVFTSVS